MANELPLHTRGLGSDRLTGIVNFSDYQTYIIRVLSVTSSSISLVSVLPAFYWFLRMKRSFRHHLIVMLLGSDVIRVSWYLIHPSIALTWGERVVRSGSTFCQVSGFLLAFSTEASDFAVLAIAIHVALIIFRSPKGLGSGGLYSYRYVVYALWFFLPLLAASLAFITAKKPYVAASTFCYLPLRPFWYRLALAWIPRYFVFATVSVLYVSIFVYVKIKFERLGALTGSVLDRDASLTDTAMHGADDNIQEERFTATSLWPKLVKHGLIPEQKLPQMPKLERHGLIPGSSDAQSSRHPESPRQSSTPKSLRIMDTPLKTPASKTNPGSATPRRHSPARSSVVAESSRQPSLAPSSLGPSAPRKPSAARSSLTNDSLRKPSLALSLLESDTHRKYSTGMTSVNIGSSRKLSGASGPLASRLWQDHSLSPIEPTSDSGTICRPRAVSCPNPPPRGSSLGRVLPLSYHAIDVPRTSMSAETCAPEQNFTDVTLSDPLATTRTAIRRQLRFLLIYPLVYLALWTLPLVSHLLGYSDYFVRHPSFPLTLTSVMLLSFRGGVDAAIFCCREKPWRNIQQTSGKKQSRLRGLRHVKNWRSWWSCRVVWLRRMNDPGGARRLSDANAVAEMEMRQDRQLWWWEEEGKKRRDSVWMGTDSMPADSEIEKKKKKRGRVSEIQFDGVEEDGTEGRVVDDEGVDGEVMDLGKMEAVRLWRDRQVDAGERSAV